DVMAATRDAFSPRSMIAVPDLGREPRGVTALRGVARAGGKFPVVGRHARRGIPEKAERIPPATIPPAWLERLAPGGLPLPVVAGKGGVGKTSCAAALALALAERGRVLLLSTDPAHSLGDILDLTAIGASIASASHVEGIDVVELDAETAFARRRA